MILGRKIPVSHSVWWCFYDCFMTDGEHSTEMIFIPIVLFEHFWGNGRYFLKGEEFFLGDVPCPKSDLICGSFLLPDVIAAWWLHDIITEMVSRSSQHTFPKHWAWKLYSLQLAPHSSNGKKNIYFLGDFEDKGRKGADIPVFLWCNELLRNGWVGCGFRSPTLIRW